MEAATYLGHQSAPEVVEEEVADGRVRPDVFVVLDGRNVVENESALERVPVDGRGDGGHGQRWQSQLSGHLAELLKCASLHRRNGRTAMTLSTTQSCAAPVEDHPLAPATADQQLHLDNNNKPRPLESHVESDSDILPHGPTQAHRSGARICRMVSRRRISFKRSGRGAQQLEVKEKVEESDCHFDERIHPAGARTGAHRGKTLRSPGGIQSEPLGNGVEPTASLRCGAD